MIISEDVVSCWNEEDSFNKLKTMQRETGRESWRRQFMPMESFEEKRMQSRTRSYGGGSKEAELKKGTVGLIRAAQDQTPRANAVKVEIEKL